MDDPNVYAAAIVMVVAAVFSGFVQVINAKAAAIDRKEARDSRVKLEIINKIIDEKADKIIGQGNEIHKLTNSSLDKVNADLVIAMAKIEELENLIISQAQKEVK